MATPEQVLDLNLLPPADLAGEIERLQEELRNERDRTVRALADFKNYRRRIENDGNRLSKENARAILIPLLDIMDDMEKAIHWANDSAQPVVTGVRIIYQKLAALLETHGVQPIESLGKPFDPHLHEAVAMSENEGSEPGTVFDDIRRGYVWNNELLRPAQVRVAE